MIYLSDLQEVGSISSPTIKFEGDLSDLKIIEELIKEGIRGKFIIQAIEHDENLKKLFRD